MSKKEVYPKFSVLISVYAKDVPEYLDLALKSVINQTVQPSEIILVEDGPISTGLSTVVDNYQDHFKGNFKVVVSKNNSGLGSALNLGTQYVTTDWIARMDSDDYSLSDRFEKQLKVVNEHPNLAIIGGQLEEFDSDINNIVSSRKVPTDPELIRSFIKWRSPFNHPTVLINKEKLLSVGGYQSFGNLEDYYLWARIIANNLQVINVPDVLLKMRVDQGMYDRRGRLKNLRYFMKLRRYLREQRLVSATEKVSGDIIVTLNLVVPVWLRKIVYRRVLHRS